MLVLRTKTNQWNNNTINHCLLFNQSAIHPSFHLLSFCFCSINKFTRYLQGRTELVVTRVSCHIRVMSCGSVQKVKKDKPVICHTFCSVFIKYHMLRSGTFTCVQSLWIALYPLIHISHEIVKSYINLVI